MCMIKKIIILFSLVLVFANIRTIAQKTNLSSKEFEKGIANADIQILDVRTQGEYNSGHIKNAFLADWTPIFIIYKAGKEVWRKKGMVSKEELLQQL
jgi:rhodanese-related sulfurtransferase